MAPRPACPRSRSGSTVRASTSAARPSRSPSRSSICTCSTTRAKRSGFEFSRCHPGRSEAQIRDPFPSLSEKVPEWVPGLTLVARDDSAVEIETFGDHLMKALTQGRYLGRDGEAALFDVGLG